MKSVRFLALLVGVFLSAHAVGAVGATAVPEVAATTASKKKAGPITRIDPTFWWVGMKNPKLQLLVYGPGIGASKVSLKYDGVTLNGVQKLENPNYLLVNLTISPNTRPGKLPLEFQGERKIKYDYELRARSNKVGRVQGITSADFVYLLMPDRFANGDPKNDVVKGTLVNRVARDSMYARHGGDLLGIENHFDYLKELGVTAIWPTPIVENDMPKASYHGYALTDYYAVDPRYGTNEDYVNFVRNAHRNGLKVIHDVVLNHMGSKNYLFLDQPAKDWFHQWPTFTRSNYRDAAFNDPYVSQADRKQFGEGWFDTTMPDVNQSNPLVANYLIQNFLWWVEYTGLDGYRIDTYPYSDRRFLMDWGAAIQEQYPRLGMYGEAWVQGNGQQAYFARNILPPVDGFKSNLPGVTDFQSQYAITEAMTKDAGWTDGIAKLYYALQGDWMYENALRNVVFLDNHDMSRFFSVIGEDVPKLKMALSWLLTTRGIPQLYYGTEILMKNFSNPDGLVRADFPGGFPGDIQNKFVATGRSTAEQEVFALVSKLATYRKAHPALHSGRLMQFVPQEGVYTYFRYSDAGTVMVLMNSNKDAKTVDGGRFAERLNGFSSGVEVVSGAVVLDLKTLRIPGRTAWVVELK
ncbi:alpha amylase catalytic region [Hymenobacter roseosalivarius DSM 11622]|uniref:Alpha amylase catalytic region n=1 Tax=Hymenobacter roseosalivarius DSM 11622 TaxID=645990 RepID=A0A1W1URV1_9BACT|nr:glycoside hydrolase family 13 protein [Hymenobacter roseosalivarius]SMB83817.1 alpha amylase catalytic region [Hymenobacter roseosalivarius DSM 11622]